MPNALIWFGICAALATFVCNLFGLVRANSGVDLSWDLIASVLVVLGAYQARWWWLCGVWVLMLVSVLLRIYWAATLPKEVSAAHDE